MVFETVGQSNQWINSGYTLIFDWQLDGLSEVILKQKYIGEYQGARLDDIEDAVGSDFPNLDTIVADHLICVEASGSVNEGFVERTVVYKGIPQDSTGETIIRASLTKEPIETHQDFETFAGTPEEPNEDNGAVFNDDGTFSHFKSLESDCPANTTSNYKFGIKYYLEPSLTVEQTKYKKSSSFSSPDVGKIEKPSSIDAYGHTANISPSQRDFLVIGENASKFGKGTQNTKTFLASGYKSKWNNEIYNT